MKRLSKRKFETTELPSGYTVMSGRWSAIYHWYGYINEICFDPQCEDCPEFRETINELYDVDDGFRREWCKRAARYARVPQRLSLRAKYRRKRKRKF